MNRLVAEIVKRIRTHVHTALGVTPEERLVFHGPPESILRAVFCELRESGGIEVTLPTGQLATVPVLLQVPGTKGVNPLIGESGECDESYLLELRNSPQCPRFVALIPPGQHRNLSVSSAVTEFGMASTSNSGNATVDEWWHDPFIQQLVEVALRRHSWPSDTSLMGARLLLHRAVLAANETHRHKLDRERSWFVLARVLDIDNPDDFERLWSYACGFPPMADGKLSAPQQTKVLEDLVDEIADSGFAAVERRVLAEVEESDVAEAVTSCFGHLMQCEVLTELERGAPAYYGASPSASLEAPPDWWRCLTVEVWSEILREERKAEDSLRIECVNSLIPHGRGINSVVLGEAIFELSGVSETEPVDVTFSRDSGGRKDRDKWQRRLPTESSVTDGAPPLHASPLRYTLEAPGYRKAATKIISLQTWSPGIFLYCRTSKKVTAPRNKKRGAGAGDLECDIILDGEGRHYLELYVRPPIIVSEATGTLDTSGASAVLTPTIVKVSPHCYGVEVEATAECQYDFVFIEDGARRSLHVEISCTDTSAEGASSEFERLIRLNRQRGARATADVRVDRQVRTSDLQAWILAESNVSRSFYPIVLAKDYASIWRSPSWITGNDSIISKGRFLHDPRPALEEMIPPSTFVDARVALARRIRGDDGDGLIESAQLGQWLASEDAGACAEELDAYLTSYLEWLEADPNVAAWADIIAVTDFEPDGETLVTDPYAILISPFHPVRLAWHFMAQQAMYRAYSSRARCPAASILDPDASVDIISLPLKSVTGNYLQQTYLAIECSSDYWGVLWSADWLVRLPEKGSEPPFDSHFGVQLGGIASGFSVSQVIRSLDHVHGFFSAKSSLKVLVSSAAGQNNACNEGIVDWARQRLSVGSRDEDEAPSVRRKNLQIFDDRRDATRPVDAIVSNLVDDTGNAVRWYRGVPEGIKPDLGIIAQLESTNARVNALDLSSPLAVAGLLRFRIRKQLSAGGGAFLIESRAAMKGPPSGDGTADKLVRAVTRLENLGEQRLGYSFAPSVNLVDSVLQGKQADFAAVSSSAVDPACFLGGWLSNAYLWDYELPSYSHRSGDSNGYYLLSQVRAVDRDAIRNALACLPGCGTLEDDSIDEVMLEVARRGIPTIRGLARGGAGAAGDVGMLVAARVLQDEFRKGDESSSLLPTIKVLENATRISLVVPVDPFHCHLSELRDAIGFADGLRPDLLVIGIDVTDSQVRCKLTPTEVKFRGTQAMGVTDAKRALDQAAALSALLVRLQDRAYKEDILLWRLAFQHLIASMIGYAFRVYSQHHEVKSTMHPWSHIHSRVLEAILFDDEAIEIDVKGRLIIIDPSSASGPRDVDQDGFKETIVISTSDASSIIKGEPQDLYRDIERAIGDWNFFSGTGRSLPVRDTSYTKDESAETGGSRSRHAAPESTGIIDGKSTNEDLASDTLATEYPDNQQSGSAQFVHANPNRPEIRAPDTPASPVGEGVEILVGSATETFRDEHRWLNLSDTNLNQLNIGVVGDLGTGKTQLLKALVHQIAGAAEVNQSIRPRILIFDYKNDYSEESFVRTTGAKVVQPHRLPFNLFDLSRSTGLVAPWLDRFKFFADVIEKIFPGVGPVQRQQLKSAVRQAYADSEGAGRQPTIYDVHTQYRHSLGGKSDSPLAIIDDLVDMEIFDPAPNPSSNFADFLEGIVVISLSALGQDDRTKNMLVAIMLNLYYEHMLRIPKRPFIGSSPQLRTLDSFLLVDEADNIMRYEFDVLRKVLLQGREFGVGVILASQYLRHFKTGGTDYREPLLTWFIHKVPNITPQELSSLGLTANVAGFAERIKALAKHECLYKSHGASGEIIRGIPFYELVETQKA